MAAVPRINSRMAIRLERRPDRTQTQLRLLAQEPPQRVVRGFAQADGSALVHLHNVSGGILGGDQLSLEVEVGPGAAAQVTTTGATRIYRRRHGSGPSVQTTRLRVERGGLLEYLPDAIIPFAGSRFRQLTHVELATDAGLFMWEIATPGRVASGEVFKFDALTLNFALCAEGEPIALERLDIVPTRAKPTSPLRFGSMRYLATFYACRVGQTPETWAELEDALSRLAREFSRPDSRVWGASTLVDHGVVVRGLSRDGGGLEQELTGFWQVAKQQLYGLPALPPRKLY